MFNSITPPPPGFFLWYISDGAHEVANVSETITDPSLIPPLVATAETNRVGVIESFDDAAAALLNCDPERASGTLLIGFVDPVSQRQFLEDMYRARRTPGALRSKLFLRPRRRLPLRCETVVTAAGTPGDRLRWSFRPDEAEQPAQHPALLGADAALEAGEKAAQRLARDLHDDAGQLLAALHLAIEDVGRDLPDPARERVLGMRELVRSVEEQLRLLSHDMRAPVLEDLGLAAALEALGRGVALRNRVKVVVKALYRERLSSCVETHFYRIAQEALSNAVRHGRPARIVVRLQKCADKVLLSIADDGAGFDVPRALVPRPGRGIGLRGIEERAEALGGTVSLESTPSKGTTVTVMAPLCP
jgi:signal transduction histidine kinase